MSALIRTWLLVTKPMITRRKDQLADITPEQRRQRVAEILACGVLLWRRAALWYAEHSAQSRHARLEVSSETSLFVTVGFETDSETTNAR